MPRILKTYYKLEAGKVNTGHRLYKKRDTTGRIYFTMSKYLRGEKRVMNFTAQYLIDNRHFILMEGINKIFFGDK